MSCYLYIFNFFDFKILLLTVLIRPCMDWHLII